MFESKNEFPLFPTTLWTFKIPSDVSDRINTEIRDLLDRLVAAAPANNPGAFLQTEHDLHTLPEMQELSGYFMNAVDDVVRLLSTKHKEMEITGCWANIHPSDHIHRPHSHFNNFLSAVYYVTVPQGGNQITFHDPRTQHYIIYPAVERFNRYNSEHGFFEVEEGLLLLFPSWLVHSVPPGTSKEPRISISFNVNFSDFNARVSRPMWVGNVPTHPKPL